MHPISQNNYALPPKLDDTSIISLAGGGRNVADLMDDDIDPPLLSPCIEITGFEMPASMIVPMINREEEILLVVRRNPDYFTQVQKQLDVSTCKKFESTLYAPRQKLNDQEWLCRIENLLVKLSPTLWERFQVLIDHYPTLARDQNPNIQSPPPLTPVSTPFFPPFLAQLKEQKKSSSSHSIATSGASSFDICSRIMVIFLIPVFGTRNLGTPIWMIFFRNAN
ncbi:hypothetical protein BC941DRAFT_477670 [Chlamydoabsidia padenii]|nr:hypothetical protein BC941DRAFT_477670 [Chlamydoabsidia padenii]